MDLNSFGNCTWICAPVNGLTLVESCDQSNPLKIAAGKKTVWFGSNEFKNIIFENTKIFWIAKVRF